MELAETRANAHTAWPRPEAGSRQSWVQLALSRPAIPLILGVLTFAVFAPSIWNDFVDWDDQVNLKANEQFRGLGWPQIKWMFTAILMGHYIPVTWLTFGLDYLIWGMDPRGYHLSNVALHAANASVFYLVALRLLGRTLATERSWVQLCAATAALFFALHPLRAESVAWATERRDVLSGFFALLTVLLYLCAAEAKGGRQLRLLTAAVATYLLALGSKSIVMSLPLALVVLDVYPLRRLPGSWRRWGDVELRGIWREKIPFFALAGLGAIVSWYAVAANDFFTPADKYPLIARIGFVFYSLAFYASKTLFPIGLTPLYELPQRVDLLTPQFLGPIVAVVLGGLTLLAVRHRWPAGLAAAVYYAITIGPVSGLVHAGHQLAHDRYSYLSCLSLALLVGALPAVVLDLRRQGAVGGALSRMILAGIGAWLTALAVMTAYQVQVWRDSETLWRYAVDADDNCSVCHHNLGHSLLWGGRPVHALPHLERALELRPDRLTLRTSLGVAHARRGAPAQALPYFERVLEARPASVDVLVHKALALVDARRPEEAHGVLIHAVSIDGKDPVTRTNLGAVLTQLGRSEEALPHLRRAIDLRPRAPQPRLALGIALLALDRYDEALEQYDVLMSMDTPEARSHATALAPRLILEW